MKFLLTISKWINKVPFPGKNWIRPSMLAVYTSTGTKKLKKSLLAIGVLLLMIAGHALQCDMGIYIYNHKESIVYQGIGLVYAVLNFLVTYTQVVILGRLLLHLWHYRNKTFLIEHRQLFKKYSPRYGGLFVIGTLLGQIVVSIIYCSN